MDKKKKPTKRLRREPKDDREIRAIEADADREMFGDDADWMEAAGYGPVGCK